MSQTATVRQGQFEFPPFACSEVAVDERDGSSEDDELCAVVELVVTSAQDREQGIGSPESRQAP